MIDSWQAIRNLVYWREGKSGSPKCFTQWVHAVAVARGEVATMYSN